MGLLLHILGIDDTSGPWYAFWSGSGSDITELAIVGGLIGIYRKHNCGVRHCWRIARHDFTDTDGGLVHHLCRKHHPLHPGRKPVTAAHIREQHHLHVSRQKRDE